MKFLCLLSALCLCVATSQADDPAESVVNKIVAVVNDDVITLSDLRREVALFLQQKQVSAEELDALAREILEQLIDLRLVLTVAAEEEISLSSADELEVQALLAQDVADHNNRAQFIEDLHRMGYTESDYVARLRANILSQKTTARMLFQDPFIQPRDLREYYEQNRHLYQVDAKIKVRHLMLSEKVWEAEELQRRLEEVKAELARGTSLAELVDTYSDGPHKGDNGVWELKTPEDFIPPLGERVFELSEGERSEVLESHLGYHLVEVIQREVAQTLPFSEVQGQIEQRVRKDLWVKRLDQWRLRLRERAYIQVFLD